MFYFCLFFYRHPCVATVANYVCFCLSASLRSNGGRLCFTSVYFLSAPLRSNGGRLCFATVYLFFFIFFIHRLFSETTRPILTKFSGIVYSGVV